MKVLVFTRHTPLPWEDGAGAYLFDILKYLKEKGIEVHVAWLGCPERFKWKGIWANPRSYSQFVVLHVPGGIRLGRYQFFPAIYWLPFKARVMHKVKSVFASLGFQIKPKSKVDYAVPSNSDEHLGWMAEPSQAEFTFAAKVAGSIRPDAVIANYAWMTPLFEISGCEGATRVCLHHDVAWRRAEIQAELEQTFPEISKEEEGRLLNRAEVIIGISESDVIEIKDMAPSIEVIAAPKAFQCRPLRHGNDKKVLFVGSGNALNADGLSWFLREVWPIVRRAEPDARMDICGSIFGAVKARPDGVSFHSIVRDLVPFYEMADVVVVPLLKSTGLNIKLVEAASYGRAIVATPSTLSGAPFLRGQVLSASEPIEFADSVISLLRNRSNRILLGERALAAVRYNLDVHVCYGPAFHSLQKKNQGGYGMGAAELSKQN